MASTLFEKIWDRHVAHTLTDGSSLVYLDRVFLHERTGAVALSGMREAGRTVARPAHVFATMDHIVDTFPGRGDDTAVPGGKQYIQAMRKEAQAAQITLFDIHDPRHGISHLIGAEQGIALPGLVVACPDSHTCTLGALGALGWGIGTSDCEHALTTQTLRASKPKQMRVRFHGALGPGVTAKDMALHLISAFGAGGAAGMAVEFCGDTIDALAVEARFTLCNMAVEFSAFTGIIAPDEAVFEYIKGRAYAPDEVAWAQAMRHWRALGTDADAVFDREVSIDATTVMPTITWGTSPEHAIAIDSTVPSPQNAADEAAREAMLGALQYMGLRPGQALLGLPIDGAFIGSCTNSRISDLRAAAGVLRGQRVAPGVRAICSPGSAQVKRDAEREGLDRVFTDAGFEWREAGCSLCFYAGGEAFEPQQRVMTSTNRNFRGRQGRGARSHLASPAVVAAAAVAGKIADVRKVTVR